jgi:hypothetical protein
MESKQKYFRGEIKFFRNIAWFSNIHNNHSDPNRVNIKNYLLKNLYFKKKLYFV